MPVMMLEAILLILTLGMIYALMSEGLWGAALMFFNCLFAALISLNFYEPVAGLIVENASFAANWADMLALMVLFIVPLLLLRLATETIAPAMVRFPTPVYHLGRFIFAVGGSFITMGMIMLGFETAPVQKKLVGVVDYKYQPTLLLKERFDRDLLAFFQYTSGYTFARNGAGDAGDFEYPARPMLFDPRGEWLLRHQEARPYGAETILEAEPAEAKAPAPAATPGSGPGGGGPQSRGRGGSG